MHAFDLYSFINAATVQINIKIDAPNNIIIIKLKSVKIEW